MSDQMLSGSQSAPPVKWDSNYLSLVSAYGIVCGLMCPLAISSTFLRETGLSHGAGDSFGALFLVFYGITMLVLAALRKFADKRRYQFEMPLAIAAVFTGNMLMLLVNVGELRADAPYALAAAALIGSGLASLELMLMTKATEISHDKGIHLTQAVSAAFFTGTIISVAIFLATGTLEIAFALSAASLLWIPYAKGVVPKGYASDLAFSRAGMRGFAKAILCIAALSFVFGVVSQVAAITGEDLVPIELQGVAGLGTASLLLFALGRKRSVPSMGAFYGMLFPIVAAALVLLPFITVPAANMAVTILVFIAYYMASLNVRIVICELAHQERASVKLHLGLALGITSFLILLGVAFGSSMLNDSNPALDLSAVSLVSLFILAMASFLLSRMDLQDEDRAAMSPSTTPATAKSASAVKNEEGTSRFNTPAATFARNQGLTTRETEVFVLLIHGRTREYIATELGISANTVKGHIRNVYQKCNVSSKQDLLDLYEIYLSKQTQQ